MNPRKLARWCFVAAALGIILAAPLATVFAQAYREAPLNPDLVRWVEEGQAPRLMTLSSQASSAYLPGLIPSPLDRSFLREPVKPVVRGLKSLAPTDPVFDLRALGAVTPVKDQVLSGPCWAFSALASVEGWLLRQRSETHDFSENHLKNNHGFDWGHLAGGNDDMAAAYFRRWAGPIDEADDPYNPTSGTSTPGPWTVRKYCETRHEYVSPTGIKQALINESVLYSTMYWIESAFRASDNTYYYHDSPTTPTNHGIGIVGWDNTKATAGGTGAWIVKNTWGSTWGESGFFYLSYNDTRAVKYASAFCDLVDTSKYTANYQYDPLGATGSVGDGSSHTCWAANRFVASANGLLGAVGFHAVDVNMTYEIKVFDTFAGDAFSNQLGATVSGSLLYSGDYTIPIDPPIALTNGNDFAIVVKFVTPNTGYPVPIEDNIPGYSSAAAAGPGQSYLSLDGTHFSDLTTLTDELNTILWPEANVCIKGYTLTPLVLGGIALADGSSADNAFNADPAQYTNTTAVRVTLSGVVGNPTQVYLSEDSGFSGCVPVAYVGDGPYDFTLSATQGAHTVYAKLGSGGQESGLAGASIALDGVAPVTTLATSSASPTSDTLLPISIQFDSGATDVHGTFAAGDLAVTNATKGALGGGGGSFTIDLTPSSTSCVVDVTLAAGAAYDRAGNPSTAPTALQIIVDPFPRDVVYVDLNNAGGVQTGSAAYPYQRFVDATNRVIAGGTVSIAGGSYNEPTRINQAMRLEASGGPVTIGR